VGHRTGPHSVKEKHFMLLFGIEFRFLGVPARSLVTTLTYTVCAANNTALETTCSLQVQCEVIQSQTNTRPPTLCCDWRSAANFYER